MALPTVGSLVPKGISVHRKIRSHPLAHLTHPGRRPSCIAHELACHCQSKGPQQCLVLRTIKTSIGPYPLCRLTLVAHLLGMPMYRGARGGNRLSLHFLLLNLPAPVKEHRFPHRSLTSFLMLLMPPVPPVSSFRHRSHSSPSHVGMNQHSQQVFDLPYSQGHERHRKRLGEALLRPFPVCANQ